MAQATEQDKQHQSWMDVTATAMHRIHRANGYKGPATAPLIRPQYPRPSPDKANEDKSG